MSCPVRGKSCPGKTTRVISITQYFGENKNALFYGPDGHNGIDFGVRHIRSPKYDGDSEKSKAYAPILCPYNGTVISDRETQSDTKGRYIEIKTDVIKINGKLCKAKIVLFHLAFIKKRITLGTKVKRGELLAYGGNTGEWTTGPHSHFGLKIYWQKSDGSFDADGVYIDPLPFFRACKSPMSGKLNGVMRYWHRGEKINKQTYLSLIK